MKLSYAVKITAWLRFASRNNVPINPAILMQKANDFSQAAGHEDFNLLMDGFVGGRSIHIVIELHTMGAESDGLLLHITVSLTYRRHLESLHKKLTSRVALLRRLAGSGLGVGATTLRTATLALMHSTGEHCAPVWCSIAHTRLIDPAVNDALRIVIGCLRPTPVDNLPTLTGIQPAELRRIGATLSLARGAMELGHLLHLALTRPSSANARRLKSRHPFVPAAQHLMTTTTYVRGNGRITNGMRSGRTTPQDSALSSPTPAPTPRNDPPKKRRGPA